MLALLMVENFFMQSLMSSETLQGVLGSRENGVKKCREQGAWVQKDQGAGSMRM